MKNPILKLHVKYHGTFINPTIPIQSDENGNCLSQGCFSHTNHSKRWMFRRQAPGRSSGLALGSSSVDQLVRLPARWLRFSWPIGKPHGKCQIYGGFPKKLGYHPLSSMSRTMVFSTHQPFLGDPHDYGNPRMKTPGK